MPLPMMFPSDLNGEFAIGGEPGVCGQQPQRFCHSLGDQQAIKAIGVTDREPLHTRRALVRDGK
jgi:hypothetical protein